MENCDLCGILTHERELTLVNGMFICQKCVHQ